MQPSSLRLLFVSVVLSLIAQGCTAPANQSPDGSAAEGLAPEGGTLEDTISVMHSPTPTKVAGSPDPYQVTLHNAGNATVRVTLHVDGKVSCHLDISPNTSDTCYSESSFDQQGHVVVFRGLVLNPDGNVSSLDALYSRLQMFSREVIVEFTEARATATQIVPKPNAALVNVTYSRGGADISDSTDCRYRPTSQRTTCHILTFQVRNNMSEVHLPVDFREWKATTNEGRTILPVTADGLTAGPKSQQSWGVYFETHGGSARISSVTWSPHWAEAPYEFNIPPYRVNYDD